MERRLSERKFTDVKVYVSLPGHPAVCCAASDISNAGVFLETNPLHIPRHKRLDLVFALRIKSSNVVRMRHVAAVVTRSESNGVGMVFSRTRNPGRSG